MIRRCTDENDPYYQNYGGRGVKVCRRWLEFSNFVNDMGPRPEHHWITLKCSTRNYSPSNCKWISPGKLNQKRARAAKRKERAALLKALQESVKQLDASPRKPS